MYLTSQRRTVERSAADEVIDEALRRSSARTWFPDLIVAFCLVTGFWFGNFVSEHAASAWKRVEKDVASFERVVRIDPDASTPRLSPRTLS